MSVAPRWVPAERDDASRAEPTSGDDGTQAHRAIPDDRDDAAGPNAAADCGVMAGAHHIGEREKRAQRRVGMTGPGDPDESGVRERDAHRLALAAVDSVVPERATGDAVRRPPGTTVCARAVAVCERSDDEIAFRDADHV